MSEIVIRARARTGTNIDSSKFAVTTHGASGGRLIIP